MPLPTKWHKKRNSNKQPPAGFEYVEPVLEALENELRDKVKESNVNKRKTESMWPVHQINWQKTRYIYDMYYTYKRIDKKVYDYILDQKLVDAALIAKWKKPGYERLCSTYVINPTNYKFGSSSLCRVPWFDRTEDQKQARDPTTGCMGCASGKNAGPRNIFGTKYGQNLAAVQIAREKRMQEKQQRQEEQEAREINRRSIDHDNDDDDASTDEEGNIDGDDDYGPSPAAGIWAGSQKLVQESEQIADPDGEAETDNEEENENSDDDDDDGVHNAGDDDRPPAKKTRVEG